jgi:hypothetical protein
MKNTNIILGVIMVLMSVIYYYSIDSVSKGKRIQREYIDSLQDELLILKIDNGRYEIILDNIWQVDSNIIINATKNIE